MLLTTVLKRFRVGSRNFGTFNINLWSIKKLFLVPWVTWCHHSNEFVEEYSRFSEVIASYVSL